MNPKVDAYLNKITNWQKETEVLRNILLDCRLTEDLKWGKPCYSYNNANVAIIQGFKEYFALLFFKGALLGDPEEILMKTGENTQSGRQIRFSDVAEILGLEPVLRAYIYEAIEVEKNGLKVELKKTEEYPVPEEFQAKLDELPLLQTAFDALTPGRKRAYLLHFAAPKHSKTRESRIEKCIPQILNGKGLNE